MNIDIHNIKSMKVVKLNSPTLQSPINIPEEIIDIEQEKKQRRDIGSKMFPNLKSMGIRDR